MAITSVVVFHIWAYLARSYYSDEGIANGDVLSRIAARGYYGVQLFFVISGFILALPFAGQYLKGRRPVRIGSYFARRVTRLEPPYVINLLLCFVLITIDRGLPWVELLPNLGASLIYQHSLLFGVPSILNHITWSLEIEVQFYVLVPALTQVFRIKDVVLRRSLLVGVALCVIGINQLSGSVDVIEGLHLGRYLHLFLVGFLLADIYVVDWDGVPSLANRWDVVGMGAWALLVFFALDDKPWTPYLTTALILPAYIGVFRGPLLKRLFSLRWISIVGGMCYSIYLYHLLVGAVLVRWFPDVGAGGPFWLHLVVQSCIHLVVVVLVSSVFFVLAERPFMTRWWGVRERRDA